MAFKLIDESIQPMNTCNRTMRSPLNWLHGEIRCSLKSLKISSWRAYLEHPHCVVIEATKGS
jgi:hypothetical protein